MKIKHLQQLFITLCENKSSKMNCLTTTCEINKKEVIFGMCFEEMKLEIIYTKKNQMFIPPSMIYSRIYLDKNSSVYFHLPEIISFLEEIDFRACYFPYIENIYRMNNCFYALFELLDEYKEILLEMDHQTKYRLIEYQRDFLLKEFKEEHDSELEFEREFYEKYYFLSRYSVFEGYYAFLKEDYQKAIKEYEKLSKKDSLMDYEKQLVDYIKNIDCYDAMKDECFALDDVQPYLETSKRSRKEILLNVLWMYFPCMAFMCVFMAILRFVLSNQSVVYCGVDWYLGIVCGALPAIFGGIAFRRIIMKCMRYKNLIQAFDFDDILNSEFTNRFATCSFIVASLISIAFACILSFDCVSFYDSYLKVSGDYLFDRIYYSYDSIEKVYHIDARYNEDGDRIERESYILYFEDGNSLDLDGYTSVDVSENEILPLLNQSVEYVDSDRDLEFVEE